MKFNFKIQIKYLLFFLFSNLIILESYSIESLKWYTEDYPPFNYRSADGKMNSGIAIELLEATHRNLYKKGKINKSVSRKHYRLVPWQRAYNKALKKGRKNVVFSTTRTEEREKLFKWFGPIASNKNVLFALKGQAKLKKENIKRAIQQGKVTGIRGDVGLNYVSSKIGVSEKYFVIANSADAMFRLLKRRRVKFMSYGELTTFHLIKKLNLKLSDFEVVYTLAESELWYAVNKSVSDRTVKIYQESLEDAKNKNLKLKNKLKKDFNLNIEETKLKNSLFSEKNCPHKKVACGRW
ncbi:MAG: transporter substrate-binding domain-containing protein [Bdellovibrionota bacterium]|nr:transporter substrate-binding domain-containing protein [Bdellovibrionota bacterium]